MINTSKMTHTHKLLLKVLGDGNPHSRAEVFEAMEDEWMSWDTVLKHISNLRLLLKPQGYDVICQYSRLRYQYRLIRTLVNPNDGRR